MRRERERGKEMYVELDVQLAKYELVDRLEGNNTD